MQDTNLIESQIRFRGHVVNFGVERLRLRIRSKGIKCEGYPA
jgi:hypothetical protein